MMVLSTAAVWVVAFTALAHGAVISGSNDKEQPACYEQCFAMYVMPVCGSDGKIYSSPCQLNAASCRLRKAGLSVERRPMTECTPHKSDSEQSAEYRRREIEEQPCSEYCFALYRLPVCGSDGKIYLSKCEMDAKSCRLQKAGLQGLEAKPMDTCL